MKGLLGRFKDSDHLWITVAGLTNAAEAVVMSMIVTRVTGLRDAGILTIAFAIGNLFMQIGKFGVRNFQVTDVRREYSFREYLYVRWCTLAVMALATGLYGVYLYIFKGDAPDKIGVILAICGIYGIEAWEDLYWGYYQQQGRLDAGAKAFCFRWWSIFVTFFIFLQISHSLLFTTYCCLLVSLIVAVILWRLYFGRIAAPEDRFPSDRSNAKEKPFFQRALVGIFRASYPLFISAFLSFYINNVAKYAIDAVLSDEAQACYGFVAMPVFVIGLLNSFIYTPSMVNLAREWEERKHMAFMGRVRRQIGIVFVLAGFCILGAAVIGIPCLSLLYGTDLSDYWTELVVLQVAGLFLALSGYLGVLLTVLRRQRVLLWGYVCTALLAFLVMNPMVVRFGILGAAVSYLTVLVLLCIMQTVAFVWVYYRKAVR